MEPAPSIRYLPHREIDFEKWDHCIESADNGLIYGYSFYLDTMARHWDALVMEDYRAVMPLTWNRKFGIHYLYQPFLTSQLGIFGNDTDMALSAAFVNEIPGRYRLIEISLNRGNHLAGHSLLSNNYVLSLSKPYEVLYAAYRENIQRNARKARQAGCTAVWAFPVEQVIELAVKQMGSYGKESQENVNRFRSLYSLLSSKKMAGTFGIQSAKNELIASCVFFYSHGRAYYILVGNHPDGRTIGASHLLIDEFIKLHAGQDLLLDFEGSDIRNLAFFYSSFGAHLETYPILRINRLPFYAKWMKK
jgi:hypothetical protein